MVKVGHITFVLRVLQELLDFSYSQGLLEDLVFALLELLSLCLLGLQNRLLILAQGLRGRLLR